MRISVCEGIKAKLLAAGPDGLLGGKFVAVHESATGTLRVSSLRHTNSVGIGGIADINGSVALADSVEFGPDSDIGPADRLLNARHTRRLVHRVLQSGRHLSLSFRWRDG
jgi:hypothetical protein